MNQYRTIEQMCSDAHSITLMEVTLGRVGTLQHVKRSIQCQDCVSEYYTERTYFYM